MKFAEKFAMSLLAGCVAGGTCGIDAHAQASSTGAGTSAPAATQPDTGPQLSDIVVTAQKRSENLQKVPISITAITQSTLTARHFDSTSDLQLAEPSLVYNTLTGFAQPYLRGVGSDLLEPNADASVATYIDGVYISNNSSTVQSLLGVDRIEVIAGPQGTLYGRNAVAGAINVITKSPGQNLDAGLMATGGNYGRAEGSGYLSGGLTDHLSAGIYAGVIRTDPYEKLAQAPVSSTIGGRLFPFHNLPDGDEDRNLSWGVRAKIIWSPTTWFKLTGTAEHIESSNRDDEAVRNTQPNATGYVLGAPDIIQNYLVTSDTANYATYRQNGEILREEFDLGGPTVVGISAYRDLVRVGNVDADGTAAPILTLHVLNYSYQYSQELQILSAPQSPIKWIAGLYYFNEKTGYDPSATISSVIFPPPVAASASFGRVIVHSYAAFAQITVPLSFISRDLSVTAGGRYTQDHKSFTGETANYDDGGNIIGAPTFSAEQHAWNKFTPKVTLQYQWGNTLAYLTYSVGFKSGAYNLTSTANPGPVNPETLSDIEGGIKSDFFNHRLRINLSAFHYKLKNLQTADTFLDGSGVLETSIENAQGTVIYGGEFATSVAVSHDLKLNGSIAYTPYAKYSDFPDAAGYAPGVVGNTAISVNATGTRLQRAPRVVVVAGLDYKHQLAQGGALTFSGNLYYNSGFYWDAAHDGQQTAYALVDLSAGYSFPGKHLSVTAWVTNLGNRYYAAGQTYTVLGNLTHDAPPRMFGVTVSWKM